jgi:hypothetical protein
MTAFRLEGTSLDGREKQEGLIATMTRVPLDLLAVQKCHVRTPSTGRNASTRYRFASVLVRVKFALMTRLAGMVVSGLPHHVMQRGNRREPIFFEDGDQEIYLLRKAGRHCGNGSGCRRRYGPKITNCC